MTGTGPEDELQRYYTRQDEKPGQVGATYAPTDPRNSKPIGGVKIGDEFVFMTTADIPKLQIEKIIAACRSIVSGKGAYAALVYLSRSRVDDIEILFQSTESTDVRQRWERLWVLSPYFSRVTRHPEGRDMLIKRMGEDLSALQLLSKFLEHKNDSVKRIFKRLHDPLITMLLRNLHTNQNDTRNRSMVVEILSAFERDRKVLHTLLEGIPEIRDPDKILALLQTRQKPGSRLSPGVIMQRLQDMGND